MYSISVSSDGSPWSVPASPEPELPVTPGYSMPNTGNSFDYFLFPFLFHVLVSDFATFSLALLPEGLDSRGRNLPPRSIYHLMCTAVLAVLLHCGKVDIRLLNRS